MSSILCDTPGSSILSSVLGANMLSCLTYFSRHPFRPGSRDALPVGTFVACTGSKYAFNRLLLLRLDFPTRALRVNSSIGAVILVRRAWQAQDLPGFDADCGFQMVEILLDTAIPRLLTFSLCVCCARKMFCSRQWFGFQNRSYNVRVTQGDCQATSVLDPACLFALVKRDTPAH